MDFDILCIVIGMITIVWSHDKIKEYPESIVLRGLYYGGYYEIGAGVAFLLFA